MSRPYHCASTKPFHNVVCKCCSQVQSVRNVTFLPRKTLCMRPTINLLILNVMPLLYTNDCNSGPNLNILTMFFSTKRLGMCLSFFKIIHYFLN